MGAPDGEAVAACRHLLAMERFPAMRGWRNTVLTERGPDGPRYVVRIWTDTPADQARPTGVPDRVYVVTGAGDGTAGIGDIEQVHPKVGSGTATP